MYKSRRKRIFAKKTAAVMIAAALITSAILPVASEIAGMSASVMAAGYTAERSVSTVTGGYNDVFPTRLFGY